MLKTSPGLDVALQMWLRAVKRDLRISLEVRSSGLEMASLNGKEDKVSSVVDLKATAIAPFLNGSVF